MNYARMLPGGKKGIWKAIRWLLERIYPRLFKVIGEAVLLAETHAPPLSGSEKWKFAWDHIREAFDDWEDWKWLANLIIEIKVGDLLTDGKRRIYTLIDKI